MLADIEIINSELLREYKEDKKGILDSVTRGMGVEEVASIAGMDITGVIEIQKGFSTKG